MSRLQILAVTFITALLLSIGAGAGAWYYLYGPSDISAAQLVPANTLLFASIPNGATVAEGYQTSQLKTLVESPNMKPLLDAIAQGMGAKNSDLLQTFVPNLSGESFFAVTHFDPQHPEDVGVIAAMKPKAGLGDFGAFLDKLKAAYPDLLKMAKTGKDTAAGHDYEWIQGPGMPVKVCVANIRGWIVTTLGEASLQDWIERFEKRATTSSLADNGDYRAAVGRVGDDPMTLVYLNYHDLIDLLVKQLGKVQPAMTDMMMKKVKDIGGAAMATRFENGEIVDRYSFLISRQAQLENGMPTDPCPFDTLRFTSRDTRIYSAVSMNWKQYAKNLKEQLDADPKNPMSGMVLGQVQEWFRQAGLDPQRNVLDALGPECSLQAEWNDGMNFPEVGLLVKLDKPDDFKPVIGAILDSVRKQYATTAVIKQISQNGQDFATLNFVPVGIISPTITENGPYFGLFLTANHAVRAFQRDPSLTLAQNENFKRQIGDKRNGAQQILYVDSPYMLNRAYKTALPYISIAAMFNKPLANALQGRQLPDDLSWLAPIGTYSCVFKTDDSGMDGYSVSGIGNQTILLAGASIAVLEALGQQVKSAFPLANGQSAAGSTPGAVPPAPSTPPPVSAPAPAPSTPSPAAPTPSPAPAPAPDQSATPAAPPPAAPAPPSALASPDAAAPSSSSTNAPSPSPAAPQ